MERLAQAALIGKQLGARFWPGALLGLVSGITIFALVNGNVRWALRLWHVPMWHSPAEVIARTYVFTIFPAFAGGLIAGAPIRRRIAIPGGIAVALTVTFYLEWGRLLLEDGTLLTPFLVFSAFDLVSSVVTLASLMAFFSTVFAIAPAIAIAIAAGSIRKRTSALIWGVPLVIVVSAVPCRLFDEGPTPEEDVLLALDAYARENDFLEYEVSAFVFTDEEVCAEIRSRNFDPVECDTVIDGRAVRIEHCGPKEDVGNCARMGLNFR